MTTEEIQRHLGNIIIIDNPNAREMYSHDIGDIPPVMMKMLFRNMPDFVVQPKNVDEIQTILKVANDYKLPVTTRGAASWGFGGVIPVKGGIVIDLSPFRKISPVDVINKTVTVEAGARWSDIDITAKQSGLCLMTYPSSKFSTVGGWIATGGIGINSFKYGHLSKQVESMKVLTAAGEIRQLYPSDSEFDYYISTEGVFGIVVEATLKLRDVPYGSYPHLLYFSSDREAFSFIDRFVKELDQENFSPNVIRFLDENHLHDTNMTMRADIFEKKAGVLLEFSTSEDDEEFTQYIGDRKIEGTPRYVANYLWSERLFGMKAKRLGPTILASEVIIPIQSAASFIKKAKKIGSYFGVEVGIDSYIIDKNEALVMATFLCDSRRMKYYMNIPLVSILTKAALNLGAKPYGLGLWNAAYINQLFDDKRKRELRDYKNRVDPNNILNPGKFFSADAKGVMKFVFLPAVFGFAMNTMIILSPALGKLMTLLLGKEKKVDDLDYELSLHACARCGSCLSECPAYLVTGNEAVTAKGKIELARKLLNNQPVSREEAWDVFLCMHCKACEEVCQTNLELMSLWDTLEAKIENQYGRPDIQIKEFLDLVDENEEYWSMVDLRNQFSVKKRISTGTE
ncbi:MAG: FAD-binding protein [Dehalococcoidales bacterium]|nr:MAG: FAD-binding protein [Dehalococcoidales bacterium]